VCQSCCVEKKTKKVNREQKASLHPSDCEPDSMNSLCKLRDDLMLYPQGVFTYFVGEFVEMLTVATSMQMLLSANLRYQLPDMEWQKAVEFPPIIIHCTHRQYCVGCVQRDEEGKSRKYLLTLANFMVTTLCASFVLQTLQPQFPAAEGAVLE